jgi:hypothetical protein
VLQDPALVARGLESLDALIEIESRNGHLSVTGHRGRGPEDLGILFDQQPIEVAALADACATALHVTGDHRWADAVHLCADWFLGVNDARIAPSSAARTLLKLFTRS